MTKCRQSNTDLVCRLLAEVISRGGIWWADPPTPPEMDNPRFRFHRGLLSESLATAVPCPNREVLLEIAQKDPNPWGVPVTDATLFVVPYGGDDARCGWRDVHIVQIRDGFALGFVEGPCLPAKSTKETAP